MSRIRLALVVAQLCVLAGLVASCGATPEQMAAIDRYEDAKCRSFGASFGTDGYTACRLQLSQMRAIEDARREDSIITGLAVVATAAANR